MPDAAVIANLVYERDIAQVITLIGVLIGISTTMKVTQKKFENEKLD
jgi:hypothetical protein